MIKILEKVTGQRQEIFNLRNKECQSNFYEFTNNSNLFSTSALIDDVKIAGKMWLKNIKFAIMKNFRKIRISHNNHKKSEVNIIMERQTFLEPGSEEFLENESLIAEKIAEQNKRIIIEQIQEMTDPTGNLSRIKMWKIRQRVCPRNENNVPVSKINEHGELISNKKELKSLYVSTYKHRLRHRNIAPGYEQLRDLKNNLFSMRFEIAKLRKSDNWSEPELMKVLKGLKSNKATDPVGLVYELFKPGVAGSDLLRSLLILCNKIKAQCQIPKFLELANISSLYKHRGSKMDLNNDRGVFNVVTARSIIDKLVYNDYYDIMDSNMSDSNVGGRKKRNIRDNLFIVYGIINYSLKNGLDV